MIFYQFPETDLYKWWPLKPPILFTAPSASNFCRNELATDILTSICLARSCTVITLASLIYFVALDSLILRKTIRYMICHTYFGTMYLTIRYIYQISMLSKDYSATIEPVTMQIYLDFLAISMENCICWMIVLNQKYLHF